MNNNNLTGSRVRLDQFNANIGLNRGAGRLKEIMWYLTKIIFFLSSFPFPNILKTCLLRIFGAQIGHALIIKPRVNIHMPWKLTVGNNVWIGEESFILNFECVKIGNNACISQRAMLCGGNHDYGLPEMPYRNGPITICDGAWIGAGSFVGPNVTVGVDTIVSACTVVTKNLESNAIYKGNPAKYIKNRWKD